MPTLDEQQRAWLDAALAAKGRFTRAKSVKKDWENYRRRRDKVVAAAAGLPDGPQKTMVDNGLVAVDADAAQGRFAQAYKGLDALKGLAKAASADRADRIGASGLDSRLAVIRAALDDITSNADFAVRHFEGFVAQVQARPKAGDQPDLAAALAFVRDFAADELRLRADLANRQDWVRRAQALIPRHDLPRQFADLDRELALFHSLGRDAVVAGAAQRLADFKTRAAANGGRYSTPATLDAFAKSQTTAFEAALKAIRSLDGFQQRDPVSGAAAEGEARLQAEDDLRRDKVDLAMTMAALTDMANLPDTAPGPLNRAPEPAPFDAGSVLDDAMARLFPPNGELPDDVPLDKAKALVAEAKVKMAAVIGTLDPAGDDLFDLILSPPEELARKCGLALTGVDSAKGVSASQGLMLAEMGGALREEVLKACPNRMADDASEITVNGTRYTLDEVIGQGGNGAVRRYTDPATGKTIVVKSLKGQAADEEAQKQRFATMSAEMKTHRQVLNGAPGTTTTDENIIKMEGAALSADGSLHMIMEDAQGGDLGMVGNNLLVLQNMGVLPVEARNALALDLLVQTVKGMKAMEERGLVHNDLKPQNLMLTRDGTVKIIDFGESRFVDDATGEAPSAATGDFNTTPGYEAPETYKQDTVTAKADSFALAGIMKILLDPAMDERAVGREQAPVTALGRLAGALTDKDPDRRPSLDAVLASSLFDQLGSDSNPDDVADLKTAAAEMSGAMTQLKGTLTAQDLKDNLVEGRGMTDTAWAPHLNRILAQGGEVPIALFQTMPTKIDQALGAKRDALSKAAPGEEGALRQQIKDLEAKKAFWVKEIAAQTDAARAKGKAEYEARLADPATQVDAGDLGKMTVAKAVETARRLREGIAQVQADFADFAARFPELALDRMAEINKGLLKMDAQARAAEQAVREAMGPEARYYLAEQALVEVSGRFGARRSTPADLADRATPKAPDLPPNADVAAEAGPPPDPPPMPERKVV